MNKNLSIELKGLGKGILLSLVLCLLVTPLIYFTGIKKQLCHSGKHNSGCRHIRV